jgi:hypothetical protein
VIGRLSPPAQADTAIAEHPESVPAIRVRADHQVLGGVMLAVGGWTLALYVLTFFVVRQHYQEYPPHYDSIGIFAGLFEILNNVRRLGLAAVAPTVFGSGLSWLQPAYALALSWAPINSPEGLVSLNFVLLLGAQAAIVTYARTFGWSPLRQMVAATVPIVPGALYAWDGGIQDLRRDMQLVLLALAILFTSLAYVTAPDWKRGIALGLLVGLAQWSRDNAAAVILIVAVPAVVLSVVQSRRTTGLTGLVKLAVIPLAIFLLIVLPYYAETLPSTLERYRTSVWGVGESRVESLIAFWNMPFNVLLGGDSRLSGRVRTALVTVTLMVSAVSTTYILWRRHMVRVQREWLLEPAYALLLMSGAWVVVAVFLYNTLLLGYGARWHGMPFLPMAVGIVAMTVGLTGLVRREPAAESRLGPLIVAAGCAVLLISAPVRMILNQPKAEGVDGINALKAATVEISERADGRPVAFLAYDTLSRHHARFYASLADRPGITEFEPIAVANRDPIDLDQPFRPADSAQALQQRLDSSLRRWSAFALVYTDTARYADSREPLWPYQVGRPVIDGLLADPTWKTVAHFTLRERELVLLENSAFRPAPVPRRTSLNLLLNLPGSSLDSRPSVPSGSSILTAPVLSLGREAERVGGAGSVSAPWSRS